MISVFPWRKRGGRQNRWGKWWPHHYRIRSSVKTLQRGSISTDFWRERRSQPGEEMGRRMFQGLVCVKLRGRKELGAFTELEETSMGGENATTWNWRDGKSRQDPQAVSVMSWLSTKYNEKLLKVLNRE